MACNSSNLHEYCGTPSFYSAPMFTDHPENSDASLVSTCSSSCSSSLDEPGAANAYAVMPSFEDPRLTTAREATVPSPSFELNCPPSYTLAAAYYHAYPYYSAQYSSYGDGFSPLFNEQMLSQQSNAMSYPEVCTHAHYAADTSCCYSLTAPSVFDAVSTDQDLFPVTPVDDTIGALTIQPTAAAAPVFTSRGNASYSFSNPWHCTETNSDYIAPVSETVRAEPGIHPYEKRSSSKRLHRPGHQRSTKDKKRCANCGATKTPSWRRGPITKRLLCNACGLYEKVNQRRRTVLVQPDGSTRVSRGTFRADEDLICGACHATEAKRWHVRKHETFCERCAREHDCKLQELQES